MGTTTKGYPYPDITDPPDGPGQIAALAQAVDDTPGITVATYAEINAYAGADVWEGRTVYQSNTGTNRPYEGPYTHNGVEWRKPWNMPWGIMPNGVATLSTSMSATGGLFDITSLTLTNTFVANRLIEVALSLPLCVQGSGGVPEIYIHDGTTSHIVWSSDAAPGANFGAGTNIYTVGTTAGSQTFKAQANGMGGSVLVKAFTAHPARLTVKDVGPFGAAA